MTRAAEPPPHIPALTLQDELPQLVLAKATRLTQAEYLAQRVACAVPQPAP